MKLHIKDQERAEKFGVIISNMQRFVENIILFFKKDHFYVQGMDFTQTALFEVYLNKDFFERIQPCLKENSFIFLSTDWKNYAEQIEDVLRAFEDKFSIPSF